jgi:hypothetical protein
VDSKVYANASSRARSLRPTSLLQQTKCGCAEKSSRCHLCTAPLYVLDPQFALFANLISHGTASERERPRSRRRLRPQKLAEYWRKTEGTFDCQANLVFGRRRTSEGGKGTDVRPAGRVRQGAATEQKQGEVDERSAIRVSDQARLTFILPRLCGDHVARRPYEPLRPTRTYDRSGTADPRD